MKKKIFIAVPCMDSCPVEFAQSIAVMNKPEECVISFNKGSLIYDSRNHLVQQAVSWGADYMMWFDSDMTFPQDVIERLLKHMENSDIACGIYFRRVAPFEPVIYKRVDAQGDSEKYNDYPKDSTFNVEGMGFGCVMVKTSVFLDMVLNQGGGWFTPFENYGEDLAFCLRAKRLGYKMICDSTIKCGHVGHMVVSEASYETMRG